jgi:regulator of protease activity HflC (stomatin/prohibitin superfamily)
MNYTIWFGIAAITVAAIVAVALWITRTFRHEFSVPEGRAGLLYHHGLYVRRNNAGKHVIWGRGWTIHLVDLRKTSLVVSSENIVLSDKTSLKIGSHISFQVADPAKAVHETQHWPNELYHTAVRALHHVLGDFSYEELLAQQLKISAQVLAHAQPEAAKIGISILAIDLRHWMIPAEHSCAFTEILKARPIFQSSGGLAPSASQAKPVVPEVHEAK